jgi:hypothetical protein
MNMSPDATNLNTTTAYPGAYVPPAGATSTDTTSTTSTGTTGTGAGTTTGTGTTTAIDPSQSSLSASFGPYVMDMLSRGWGLANLPYTPFTGQRRAGSVSSHAVQHGSWRTGFCSGLHEPVHAERR